MPSPFPGMDPYLEEPVIWPDVHHGLISVFQETLNARLRPKYRVRVEERVYVSDEDDPGRSVIIPDLRVAQKDVRASLPLPATRAEQIETAKPIEVTTLLEEEIHEARLEIIDRAQRLVVAVIEVVSPSNKVAGSRGQASYQQKRKDVMNSPSHWVEIDLLRAGVPVAVRTALPRYDYLVHVSRAGLRPRATVWPILLHQRLPVIPIPLRDGDRDAQLDLQSAFSTVYERAAYDLEIDYGGLPAPALDEAAMNWARELIARTRA